MIEQARAILKNIFGYDSFRLLQDEIISHVLAQKDTLVIMPTGGGKSLCYQIPALIFEGITIVVSPLISLMRDQVGQLTELGIPAVFLNSSLSYEEYRHNVRLIQQKKAKLLYVAPETLFKQQTLALLASVEVSCLTIDEAHCISEWGHDFRPEYRQLVTVRKYFTDAVCIALTATATREVQKDIKDNLGFDISGQFVASFNRKNLFLQIIPKNNPTEQTLGFLQKFPQQSGIIYCFSRRQVDELYEDLLSAGFSVKPYHAGLPEIERRKNQDLFIRDDVQIIVATVAFGMGINKSNVRFVIHYDLPKNIESYYQEIGRAGRDSLRADCLLLFSYADIQKIKYFISQKSENEQRIANVHLNAMLRFSETNVCRRIPLLTYFGDDYSDKNCDMCDNCLAGEKQLDDLTIPAQKFLSCVKRTGEMFGANHIIDILRASKAEKVLKHGHGNLSTYGIGKEYSKKQWLHMSRQFLQHELLLQDMQYGSLTLTPKGYSVLKDDEKFLGILEAEKIEFSTTAKKELEYDRGLFERLRSKRKKLADAADVAPYVIFSDKTLIEMAAYFPKSREELLKIYGIGRMRLEKYGMLFLQEIRQYAEEHQLVQPQPERMPAVSSSQQRRRHHATGQKFNDGSSIPEIMTELKVKQETVLDHLYKYAQEGNEIKAEKLLTLSNLPHQQQTKVLEAFNEFGTNYLKPVFDALQGQVTYDELKILRLYSLGRE